MQLVVVAYLYGQTESYAKGHDRCCHRCTRELGPANNRAVLIQRASPYTPPLVACSESRTDVCPCDHSIQRALWQHGSPTDTRVDLCSCARYFTPSYPMRHLLTIKQAVVLSSLYCLIDGHAGYLHIPPRRLSRMLKEVPYSPIPRTRIPPPTSIFSSPSILSQRTL